MRGVLILKIKIYSVDEDGPPNPPHFPRSRVFFLGTGLWHQVFAKENREAASRFNLACIRLVTSKYIGNHKLGRGK